MVEKQAAHKRIGKRVKGLWRRACRYDRISPGQAVVNFSDENPYADEYFKAAGKFATMAR